MRLLPIILHFLIKKKLDKMSSFLICLRIGNTGFEPTTPWSQTKCSTKLS